MSDIEGGDAAGSDETPVDIEALLDSDVDGLLDAPEKTPRMSSSDRLERAFLEVIEFRRAQGRIPSSSTRDIAERKLGARLDGILADDGKIAALKPLDEFGLLDVAEAPASIEDVLRGDEFDLLGDESGLLDVSDLPVRRTPDAPDSVAKRKKSTDFARFDERLNSTLTQTKIAIGIGAFGVIVGIAGVIVALVR